MMAAEAAALLNVVLLPVLCRDLYQSATSSALRKEPPRLVAADLLYLVVFVVICGLRISLWSSCYNGIAARPSCVGPSTMIRNLIPSDVFLSSLLLPLCLAL